MSARTGLPWPSDVQQLRLDDLVLDLRFRRVIRPDGESELPQRIFDLLLLFVAEPDVLHSRQQLFERIWAGVVVEDGNLSQCVWALRKALGSERRGWLKTVSKRGYVFSPPQPAVAISAIPTPAESRPEAVPRPAPDTQAALPVRDRFAGTPRRRPQPARLLLVVAAMSIAVTAAMLLAWNNGRDTGISIVLIPVHDRGDSSTATSLLQGWLGWKLSLLPEAVLLNQSHLASEVDHGSATVVVLSSGPSSIEPGNVYVQMRIEGADGPHQIRLEGSSHRLVELVDSASNQAIATLLPHRAGEVWPTLRIRPDAMELSRTLIETRQSRQWHRMIEAGEQLLLVDPNHGLAHWLLSQARGALRQPAPAASHLAEARRLLSPLPTDANELITAWHTGLKGHYAEAVRQYSALAERHPQQLNLTLGLARGHINTAQPALAKRVLDRIDARGHPSEIRMDLHLLRSLSDMHSGDYGSARSEAEQAEQIAAVAGWAFEHGLALLLMAEIALANEHEIHDFSLFQRAAERFDAAGDRTFALSSRINAVLAEVGADTETSPRAAETLNSLLAQARNMGQYRLEFNALRVLAYHEHKHGNIPGYRERLAEATAVANASGDPLLITQTLSDKVYEQSLVGDLEPLQSALDALSQAGPDGVLGAWMRQFQAATALRSGSVHEANATLTSVLTADSGPAIDNESIRIMHRCLLGSILLIHGQPTESRGEFLACGESRAEMLQVMSLIGVAAVDLLSGDPAGANASVDKALARIDRIPSTPDRWFASLDLAYQLVRLGRTGEAWAIYTELLPAITASGYRRFEAEAHIGLAEVAVIRGDWTAVTHRIALAQSTLPQDDLLALWRLQLLRTALLVVEGNPDTALAIAQAVAAQAEARGDTLNHLLALSTTLTIAPDHPHARTEYQQLVARTGLRGTSQDWLLAQRTDEPASPMDALVSARMCGFEADP